MKCIIFCGGTGTRMREETEYRPKPMVLIGQKPILWHIMKIYQHWGFNEFILALGYKSDMIKQYFLNERYLNANFTINTKNGKVVVEKKHSLDNFKITFVETGEKAETGERFALCQEYIPSSDTDFMVTYGDGLSDVPLKEVLAFHRQQKTIGTITGVHPRSKYGVVSVGPDGLVVKGEEKPTLNDWVNGGFMFFTKEVFRHTLYNEDFFNTIQNLTETNNLSLFGHTGFWYGIDTYKEVQEVNNMWLKGEAPWKLWG